MGCENTYPDHGSDNPNGKQQSQEPIGKTYAHDWAPAMRWKALRLITWRTPRHSSEETTTFRTISELLVGNIVRHHADQEVHQELT